MSIKANNKKIKKGLELVSKLKPYLDMESKLIQGKISANNQKKTKKKTLWNPFKTNVTAIASR